MRVSVVGAAGAGEGEPRAPKRRASTADTVQQISSDPDENLRNRRASRFRRAMTETVAATVTPTIDESVILAPPPPSEAIPAAADEVVDRRRHSLPFPTGIGSRLCRPSSARTRSLAGLSDRSFAAPTPPGWAAWRSRASRYRCLAPTNGERTYRPPGRCRQHWTRHDDRCRPRAMLRRPVRSTSGAAAPAPRRQRPAPARCTGRGSSEGRPTNAPTAAVSAPAEPPSNRKTALGIAKDHSAIRAEKAPRAATHSPTEKESIISNKIFVGNLSFDTTQEELSALLVASGKSCPRSHRYRSRDWTLARLRLRRVRVRYRSCRRHPSSSTATISGAGACA